MSEWKLDELCEILDSKRVPLSAMQRAKRQGPYPYYGAQSIIDYVDDYLLDGEYLLVAEDGANLVTRTQDIANLVNGKIWVNNHAHILGYNGKCPLQLLGFILNHSNISPYVTGCAQPKLNQDNLRRIKIKLPEKVEEVSSILSSLDDKIAVNRRICENLEAQAQALFKHWFIDFAPFKDGKFVESELGMIPEGWRVGTLGDVVNQVTDKVGDRNDVRVLSPINTGKLVLSDEFFTKQVYSKSISKYIIVNPDDFAYNPARVNIGSIGRNEYSFIGCVSPVYVVFHCQEHYHFYIDFFRHGNKFKKNVEKLAIGGVRQTLRYEDMARISLVIPPKDVVISFNDIYKKMYETIIQKNDESSRLSTLRDTLLPKLMSGQIKL